VASTLEVHEQITPKQRTPLNALSPALGGHQRAQQQALPVIGFLIPQSADEVYKNMTAPFLQSLKEAGYVEGQNVAVITTKFICVNSRPNLSAPASTTSQGYRQPCSADSLPSTLRHEFLGQQCATRAERTPERLQRQAGEIGCYTSALVEIILRERTHPEQGFRACVGILRLAKSYGRERLEAACSRALEIGARSYSSVNSILKNKLDRKRPAAPADGPTIAHDNIRGPTYFH
jgi:hypothetical protein